MEIILYTVVGQLAVVGMLFRWLQVQTRDNRKGLEVVVKETYTKGETKDLIDLKLRPIEVGIEHVKDDLKDVKAMLNRLLDEKNK